MNKPYSHKKKKREVGLKKDHDHFKAASQGERLLDASAVY